MTPVVGITLVFSRKCNASCRHCGFSCSPSASETMTVKQAVRYLREAKEAVPDLQTVAITGGEPLLFPRQVAKVMSFAQQSGLWTELVTNSFWAVNWETARRRLESFRQLGLRNYVTSLDAYHAQFIPAERVRFAVESAVDLGLHVTVKTFRSDSPGPEAAWLAEIQRTAPNLKVHATGTVLVGRAADSVAPDSQVSGSEAWQGRCDSVIRFPAIHPNGDFYGCCGFGEGARLVGSLGEKPLRLLLSEMRHNLLLNLLAESGPAAIWEKLQECGSVPHGRSFQGACEVCNVFYFEEGPRAALCELLSRLRLAAA